MVDCFDDVFVANMDESDGSGDIVFDIGVCDHESIKGI